MSAYPQDLSHVRFKKLEIDLPDGVGDETRTLCPKCSHRRKPEHQKEKILKVWVKSGRVYCHNCGWKASVTGTFQNAKIVCEQDSYFYLPLPATMEDWFAERGISPETLQRAGITWNVKFFPELNAKSRCIQFPYYMNERVVGSKFRTEAHTGQKCFVSSEHCVYPPYGFDDVHGKAFETIIIVEGETDRLSWLEIGYTNCIGLPHGGIQPNKDGKPTSDNKKLNCLALLEEDIKAAKKIILAMDKDKVGELTQAELERRIGVEKCMRVTYPEDCKDSNDVLCKYGMAALEKVFTSAYEIPISGLVNITDPEVSAQYWSYYHEGFQLPVSTSLESLDWYFMPRVGEFTTVTGTPSAGKSVFVDFLSVMISKIYDWHWTVFVPESAPPARYYKHLAWIYIGKPFDKQYADRMTTQEAEEAYWWCRRHFTVISREHHKANVSTIIELGRKSIYRNGSRGFIIDPWNRFEHLVFDAGYHSETAYIAAVLDELMMFTDRNGLHTFLIAHPTKSEGQRSKYALSDNGGLDEKPVGLYGISGGANFYNMTFNGIIVHRNLLNESFKTTIIAEKIKFPGETGHFGQVVLRFDPYTRRYYDLQSEVNNVRKLKAAEQQRMRAAKENRDKQMQAIAPVVPAPAENQTLDGIFF